MKRFIGFLFCLPFVGWVIIRIVWSVTFSINCSGHMTRAGTANSIELARQEMETVVRYAEKNRMTSGYTSVLYNTPDEDVGFWYNNMKSSLDELRRVKSGASDLEKSNILIKLRESVTHHTQNGTAVTIPDGLSIFPHNVEMAWGGLVLFLLGFIGFMVMVN